MSVCAPAMERKVAGTRDALVGSQRIVVKLGSAVIVRSDGQGIASERLTGIVEQVQVGRMAEDTLPPKLVHLPL